MDDHELDVYSLKSFFVNVIGLLSFMRKANIQEQKCTEIRNIVTLLGNNISEVAPSKTQNPGNVRIRQDNAMPIYLLRLDQYLDIIERHLALCLSAQYDENK